MALALYRKYRPRTFAEVIGQEHVTEPLSQALRSGRLNHAYLFSGPRGCGKTSSARILARSLNCEKGPTPDPCGECDSCRALAPDGSGSIDVIEIDAASHGGVDDARDLRERAFYAPVSSRFKVYVIDEAHMVSSAGFNALLKLVEEPPEYVKFVFATTEPEKVLGTIKSRTHHYPFRLIPPGVLRPYLEQLTVAEGVKVEPAVFPLVVRAGAGSARDSLSVLDQLIAGAGPDGVSYNRAVALLGVTDVALIDEMCDALAADDGRGAYGVIDRVVEAGHDPRRFASDLLERLRDLIVLQQVPDAVTKGLLDAPHDQLERMGAQAAQLGQATLSRFADIVHDGLTEMRGTTAPRLLLELITARMLLPAATDSSSALLQRLERMERRLMAGGVPAAEPASYAVPAPQTPSMAPPPVSVPPVAAAPSAVSGPPAVSAPAVSTPPAVSAPPAVFTPPAVSAPPVVSAPSVVSAPPVVMGAPEPVPVAEPSPPAPAATPSAHVPAPHSQPSGGLDAVAVRRVWPDVLSLVSGRSKKAAAIVREATVQDVEGTTLVLGFKHSAHANMLNASPDVLIAALRELLGGNWQIRCEIGGGGGGGGAGRPTPPRPSPPQPSATPDRAGHTPGPQQPADALAHRSTPVAASSGASGGGWPTPAVPGGADAGWPTPAVPGGASSGGQEATAWPAAAVPGGAVAGNGAHQESTAWPTAAVPGGGAGAGVPTSAGEGFSRPGDLSGSASGGADGAGPAAQAGAPVVSSALHDGLTIGRTDGPGAAPTGGYGTGAAEGSSSSSHGRAAGPVQSAPGVPGGGSGAAGSPGALGHNGAGIAGDSAAGVSGSGVGHGPAGGPGGTGSAGDPGGHGSTGDLGGGYRPAGGAGGSHGPAGGPGGGYGAPAGSAGSGNNFGPAGGPGGHGPAGGPGGQAGGRGGVATRPEAGPQSPNGGRAAQRGTGPSRAKTAIEQAREAASRAAGGQRRAGAAAAPQAESAWEAAVGDEPPYDPEYDRPVADPRFPGLDPGDELLDDANGVRESSEEAALRLLSEALGAEKIGETSS